MPKLLSDIVRFRGDKLFNGAVNIDWIETDETKASLVAGSFVFHGPTYHGVTQTDVGISHGHRLIDTANFVKSIFHRSYGLDEKPFTLAIAGYGTGKSHLALTLAKLLSDPTGKDASVILSGIKSADHKIAAELNTLVTTANQPCLVVALNGMQSFDLASEISRQIMKQVQKFDLDISPLDNLRPRFTQASNLIQMASGNKALIEELLNSCDADDIDFILDKLKQHDDTTYSKVYRILESRNIKISTLGGESVRDIIDVASREYCGLGKPFKSIVIIFDEFGRYTEFATVKSHIAGSGALQDLFEAIQNNISKVCFLGLIQFELNAYIQRVAPEHRNEILRYVTRYQTANKVYLSINLETLIANLIEKKNPNYLSKLFDTDSALIESRIMINNISTWFPVSQNYRIWTDLKQFHKVIRKGCWPLSPYSVWLLFYLAAAGKYLQERSVLALLEDVFIRCNDRDIQNENQEFLFPVDFWSDSLQNELITSEEGGQQGAITHSYSSVIARHGSQLLSDDIKLLRSVVFASKLGMKSTTQYEAIKAIAELSGIPFQNTDDSLKTLQDEFNIIDWDEAFKQFDILGDAIPRTQFISYIRQQVASTFDETGKAALFAQQAASWCDHLINRECDFAEENKITTREWSYRAVTSTLDVLSMNIKSASDLWKDAIEVDKPRGTIIYCYVEPSRDLSVVTRDASHLLRNMARDCGVMAQPIIIVLLADEDGKLGQSLAELSILEESLSNQDIAKFGNLIPAHKQKMRDDINSRVEELIKKRLYITAFKESLDSSRIDQVGSEIFKKIYKSPIPFPFDGFTTSRGNAAKTCQMLTAELLQGRLDWNSIMSKPKMDSNRADTVLKGSWGIFMQNGSIRIRPEHPVLRGLTEKWDEKLNNNEKRIPLQEALKKLCEPPIGANIASAGLFLGVFMAARINNLSIVKSKRIISIVEWMRESIFRGYYVDLSSLHDVELIYTGESSSEWEILLDAWEQAETYVAQKEYFIQALELKDRLPVPNSQGYREMRLEDHGREALKEIDKYDKNLDAAHKKINSGMERKDISLLSWGTSDLFDLIASMTANKPRWSDHEIDAIRPHAERSRQAIIDHFFEWLKTQTPKNETPSAVGDFKNKMLHQVGKNLKKIHLEDLYDELIKYTNTCIKNVELISTAHQIVTEINLWLTTNPPSETFIRITELRVLLKVGEEYSNKIKNLASQIDMPEITTLRLNLANRLEQIKTIQKNAIKRAEDLWKTKVRTFDDTERLLTDVDELISVFEGCKEDIDDFQIMRRALRIYKDSYQQLDNNYLTSAEFDRLEIRIKSDVLGTIGEEELPWDPEETINNFIKSIAKNRTEKSKEWIQKMEEETKNLELLDVTMLNRLMNTANCPPPFLEPNHLSKLIKIRNNIETHLQKIQVEWLVEKFGELLPEMQKLFLSRIVKN